MELSERVRGVVAGGDDGWSIYYRARALIAAGERVVNLTIGDHDVKTDPTILAAIKDSMAGGALGYTPVEGIPALREAVAERVARETGVPTAPGNVVIVPGGQAGLYSALFAALDPGQSAIVIDPYYATYLQTVRAVSARPIVVETRAEEGFQPDAARIEAALEPDTRAILINTPNNPSGAVYTSERLDAVADLCRRRGLWLISDEVYYTQVWEGRHLSPRALPGMAERVMVVNSLSKSHAMTGSRMGWVVAPEAAAAHIADLSTATTYGLPGFIQEGGVFALRHAAEAEAEIAERYRRRRAAVLAALGNGPGMRADAPGGGMYVLLDLRETGLSGLAFAARLLEEDRVAVMPGESFGRAAAGHVRVALTVPEEALVDAIGRIGALAARLATQPAE